jgi:hypothetical protein
MISEKDFEISRERYISRFKKHGYSEKAVGWGEKGRLNLRYQVLYSYWGKLNGLSLLDLGAGFGDGGNEFLSAGGSSYTGIEYINEFVLRGNEQYSHFGHKFRLIQGDIASMKAYPSTDIICGSGIFNSKLNDSCNYDFIEHVIKTAFSSTRIGVAFNFLSSQCDKKENYIFYTDISKISPILESLSKNFVIRKNYFPFEFTVYISKNDTYSTETSIFDRPQLP